tara:strand:- start:1289 stop:1915 length:627 start_codon:yes stop_codon:yes gene_type:complete
MKKSVFKNIFTQSKSQLNKFWKENEKELKFIFKVQVKLWLYRLKIYEEESKNGNKELVDKFVIPKGSRQSCQLKQVSRNEFGYDGIGKLGGIKGIDCCQMYSKEATIIHKEMTMHDHVFGVTLIGWTIHTILDNKMKSGESRDVIVDYMVNTWLKKHLYFWITVCITKDENKRLNSVGKNKHTLDQKLNLIHYKDAKISDIIVKNTNL